MKEKLQEYALLAEIIGGIAIVASLLFVGLQIQQNTNLSKANAYRETIQEIADWREMLATNSELRDCLRRYIDLESNNTLTDCPMLGLMLNNIFGIYETAYFDKMYGFIGESEWSRLEAGVCVHYLTATSRKFNFSYITEEFKGYLGENCKLQ